MTVEIARKAWNRIRRKQHSIYLKIFTIKNKKVASIIESIIDRGLSYLEKEAIADLIQVAMSNEQKGVKGIIVEAGCARGGSAIALASVKNKERSFFIYDVFSMIPPPSEDDESDAHRRYQTIVNGSSSGIGANKYYGYEEDLYTKVIDSFKSFGIEVTSNNISLVKGLYQDTLKLNTPVSLAHIDCDWYDSVMTCLARIEPHIVRGGTIIVDDYYIWSGCKAAVDRYFDDEKKKKYKFIKKSRLHIVKK